MGLALRIVFALLVACLAPAAAAFAQAQSGFSLRPAAPDPAVPASQAYFILTGAPGQSVRQQVLVTNSAASPATLDLYAVDAATGATSGAVFPNRDLTPVGPGTWVRLGQSQVVVPPGGQQPVDVEVRVPADAKPGQYLAGIVAQPPASAAAAPTTTVATKQGQINVATTTRVVVAVAVTVPGPIERKLTVLGVRSSSGPLGTQLVVSVRNDGNAMLKPQGTLRLKDGSGAVKATIPLQMDTILPSGTADFTIGWPTDLPPGDYQADVALDAVDSLPTGGAASPSAAATPHVDYASGSIAVKPVAIETPNGGASGAEPIVVRRDAPAGGPESWWPYALAALAVVVVGNVVLLRRLRRPAEPPRPPIAHVAMPTAVAATAPVVLPQAAPAGERPRFVKGRASTIYLLQEGTKRPLAGWTAFVACGGAPDLSNVRLLPEEQLNAIPTGSPIAAPEDARAS